MKQLTINASPREEAGSAASGRLRRSGRIPAVVYGKTKEPVNLSVDASDLRVALREIGNNTPIVHLKEGDSEAKISIIQEVQRHPISDKYIHVDFHEVAEDETITLSVPVHTKGESYGVRNENGTMEVVLHTVHVRCLPKNAPDFIEVDVEALKVGDLIHVNELSEIEGVDYLDHGDQPVIAIIL